jgi:hypothetical protein
MFESTLLYALRGLDPARAVFSKGAARSPAPRAGGADRRMRAAECVRLDASPTPASRCC